MSGQVRSLREVLTQKAVSVFIGSTLPRAAGIAKEDAHTGISSQLNMLSHLRTLIPS